MTALSLCTKHLKQVQEKHGRILDISLLLLDEMVNNEHFMKAAGWDPVTGRKASIASINKVVRRLGQPCCFVTQERFEKVLSENS